MPNFTSRTNPRGRAKYTADVDACVSYAYELEHRIDHVARFRAHDVDERIWRLEKYVLEELKTFGAGTDAKLWPSYTSNGPRTFWNAIRRATTSNGPRFKIQLPSMIDADIDEFDEMLIETARHEHFAVGVWNSVDEQRMRRGELPLQDQVAWDLGIRGGVFLRPWFDPDAHFPFQVERWDPKTVAYETGPDGLECVYHHYFAPYYRIASKYHVKPEDEHRIQKDNEGNVEVFDCWWIEEDEKGGRHVWNTVALAGGFCLMEPKEHRDIDHLPVYLIRAFGPEVEPNTDYHYTIQRTLDQWETIYTANRDVYPWINRIYTLYGIFLRNSAVGPWFAKQTGFTDEQLKNALRPFSLVQSANPNATIQALQPPGMVSEAKEMLGQMQGEEQRGAVPYSTFGQIPFQLSGFAVNQLQGAVSITAGQMTRMMANAYRLCTDELIQQFRQRGRRVTLKGMDQRRQQFIEEIKRADLRDKYYLQVDIAPELPQDKLQEAQIAQIWAQAGIDPITIADEVLGIADPRGLLKRMIAWKQLNQEMEMEQAAKQAAKAGGVPPQVMPPEEQGFVSQHEQFQPGRQHIAFEELAAAGFATP